MTTYFRITAYHPEEDLSVIMDSFGLFEKVWQFSSELVKKGFKIIEVGSDEKFIEGQIPKTNYEPDQLILRSHQKGRPLPSTLKENGITYIAISVGDKTYIPDKEKTA